MATTKAIIDVSINTGAAAAQLRSLQDQINSFNATLNKNNLVNAQASRQLADQLIQSVNASRAFTAEQVRMETAARRLDQTLVKGKGTLGQYFSAKFRKDGAEAAAVLSLANSRAQALQTQFVKLSGAAGGFRDALAIRPLQALNDSMEVANQKAAIHSAMFRQATTSMINFGKNTQWAGRQLMVGFTVPMTIFGAAAGKTFKEIEQAAVRFKKVYGDAFTTPAEIEKNMKAVEGLALEFTKYGIAVKDTIGLAAEAAAAGAQNADLIAATTEATRLATLGQMEQQEALTATIALQNAFKLSSQDLAKEVNFLNMVENQTVVTLQDLAGAIPRVAPVIVGLGGDVRDMAAMMAAMQEGGVSAAQGANALKSGLGSLINPTNKASKVLAEMGININSIVQANRGDLMGTVTAFAQALSGLDKFTRQQALEELFGKYQYARLGALFENIIKDGTQASRVLQIAGLSAEQMAKSAERELSFISEATSTKYMAAIERFKLSIAPVGEMFMKISTPIINFFSKLFEMFDKLPEGAKTFGAFAALIVGVVVPAGTMFLGLLMNLIGTLAKFGHIIGVAMKGFGKGGFGGAIQAVSQSLRYMGLEEIDAANAAQQLGISTGIANEALLNQIKAAGNARIAIDRLSDAYARLISTQIGFAEQHPAIFGTSATAGAAASRRAPRPQRRNRGGKIKYMSDGGSTVPGFGNTDTVPAMLTPGEFVVNKQATRQNLPLLHAINDGMKMPGFNKGGKIPGIQYFGIRPGSRGGGNVGYGSYIPKSDLAQLMAEEASALAAFGPHVPRQSGIMAGERGLIPYRSLANTDPSILKLISQKMEQHFGSPTLTTLGTNVGIAPKIVAERINRDLMGDRASVSQLRQLTEMVDYYQTTFSQVPAARAVLTGLGITPLGAAESMARTLPEKLKKISSIAIGDRALWDLTREAYQDAGLMPLFDALEGQRGAIRYALPQHISSALRFGVERGSTVHGKALADVFGTENVQFTRGGKKPVYIIKGSALGAPYDVGISPGLTEDFPALGYSYQNIAKDIAGMIRIHMGAPQALNKGGIAGVQHLQNGGILRELTHLDDDLNMPERALIDFYNLSTTKDAKAKNAFVASYPRWINQGSRNGNLKKQDFINYLLNESTKDDYKLLFDEMQIPEKDREKIHKQINKKIIEDLGRLPGDIISDNGLNDTIKFSNVGNSFYSATPNKYKERLKQIRETVAEIREKRASGRGTSRRFRKTSDLAIIKAMATIAKRRSPELINNAPAIWQAMRTGLRRNSGGIIPGVQYFANAGIVQRLMKSGLQRGQLQRKLEGDNVWAGMSDDLKNQVMEWDTGKKPISLITGRIGEMIKSGKSFDIIEQALGLPPQRTSSLAGLASREQLKKWISRYTGQNPIAEYNDLTNMYRNNPMSNEDRQWFLSEVLAPAFDRRRSVLGFNNGGFIQHLIGGGPAMSSTMRRVVSSISKRKAAVQKFQKHGFNALDDEEKAILRSASEDIGNMPLFKGTSLLSPDIDQSVINSILNGRESDLIGRTISTPFGSYSADEKIARPFVFDNNETRRVNSLRQELFPSTLSLKENGVFRKPKTGKEAIQARESQVGRLPIHLDIPGMTEDEKRSAWFKWKGIDEEVWNAETQRLRRSAQEYDDLVAKGAGKGIVYKLKPATTNLPPGQSRIVSISTKDGITTITLETGKTTAAPISKLGGAPVMPGGKEELNPENEWFISGFNSGGPIQKFSNGGDVAALEAFRTKSIFESANKTTVPGYGNTDTVPAALTPGEFVINKKATAKNLPLLKAINSGNYVAANNGGMIPDIQYFAINMPQRIVQAMQSRRSIGRYIKDFYTTRLIERRALHGGSGMMRGQVPFLQDVHGWNPSGLFMAGGKDKIGNEATAIGYALNARGLGDINTARDPYHPLGGNAIFGIKSKKRAAKIIYGTDKPSKQFMDETIALLKTYGIDAEQQRHIRSARNIDELLQFSRQVAFENRIQDINGNIRTEMNSIFARTMKINEYDAFYGLNSTKTQRRVENYGISREKAKGSKSPSTDAEYYINMGDDPNQIIINPGRTGLMDVDTWQIYEKPLSEFGRKFAYFKGTGETSGVINPKRLNDVLRYIDEILTTPNVNRSSFSAIEDMVSGLNRFYRLAGESVPISHMKALDKLNKKLKSAIDSVPDNPVFSTPYTGLNAGNIVPGMGNKDTVPAMLTPGEFVVNKKATAENLGLLHAINGGSIPGFMNGGMIPGIQYFNTGTVNPITPNNIYGYDERGRPVKDANQARSLANQNRLYNDAQQKQIISPRGVERRINVGGVPQQTPRVTRNPTPPPISPRRPIMGGGRGMGIGMGMGAAGGALMMAPLIPSVAQNPGLSGALSGAGMGLSMLSMLPMMGVSGPVIAAIAGIAAAAAGTAFAIYKFRDAIDTASRKAEEFGANVGGTANALNKASEIFGVQTPAQRQAAKEMGFTPEQQQQAVNQFSTFFGSQQGQKFIEDLKGATSQERFKKLSDYMKNAIASGMTDKTGAQNFAKTVGSILGDPSLGAGVSSAISNQEAGSKAMLDLARGRESAVAQKIGTLNEDSVGFTKAAKVIGSSGQVIQDFANAAALAKENFASGDITYRKYTAIIEESRNMQIKYTDSINDALKKTNDFGATMQAVKKSLVDSGLATEEQTAALEQAAMTTYKQKVDAGKISGIPPRGGAGYGRYGGMIQNVKTLDKELYATAQSAIFGGMDVNYATELTKVIAKGKGPAARAYNELIDTQGATEAFGAAGLVRSINKGQIPGLKGNKKAIDLVINFVEQGGTSQDLQTFLYSLPEETRIHIVSAFEELDQGRRERWINDYNKIQGILGPDLSTEILLSAKYKDANSKEKDSMINGIELFEKLPPSMDKTVAYDLAMTENGKPLTLKESQVFVKSMNQGFKDLESTKESVVKKVSLDMLNTMGVDTKQANAYMDEIYKKIKDFEKLPAEQKFDIITKFSVLGLAEQAAAEYLNSTGGKGQPPFNYVTYMGLLNKVQQARNDVNKLIAEANTTVITDTSGSGGGTKSILQQLIDSIKELDKIFNRMKQLISGNFGTYRNFIAGPFAPQFIEFLKQQGEEGIKILTGNANKFLEVYRKFVEDQQKISRNQLQALPFAFQIQERATRGRTRMESRLTGAGIFGENARSAVLEAMNTEDQYFANLSNKEFNQYMTDRNFTKKQRQDYREMRKRAIINLNFATSKRMGASSRRGFAADLQAEQKTISDQVGFATSNLPTQFVERFISAGMTNINDITGKFKTLAENIMEVVRAANQLNVLNKLKEMNEDIAVTNNIMRVIPGATQEFVDELKQLGITAVSSDADIRQAAQGLNQYRINVENAKGELENLAEELDILGQTASVQIEKINKLEIEPIQKQIDKLNDSINNLERSKRPHQQAIDKLRQEEEALQKVYDDRVKALDEVQRANERIAAQQRGQMDIASALSRGDIAGAAQAALQLQQDMAQQRVQDTRDALQAQFDADREVIAGKIKEHETAIKSIDEQILAIQDQIYLKQQEIEKIKERQLALEEKIYKIQLLRDALAARNAAINAAPGEFDLLKGLFDADMGIIGGLDYSNIPNAQNFINLLKQEFGPLYSQEGIIPGQMGASAQYTPQQANKEMQESITKFVETTKTFINEESGMPKQLGDILNSTSTFVTGLSQASEALQNFVNVAKEYLNSVKEKAIGQINVALGVALKAIADAAKSNKEKGKTGKESDTQNGTKRAFGGMISYMGSKERAPGFAFGSFVPGIGNSDKVPALLTPGEFVVKKPVAQAYRSQLEALNSQLYPKMAFGGRVGIPRMPTGPVIKPKKPEVSIPRMPTLLPPKKPEVGIPRIPKLPIPKRPEFGIMNTNPSIFPQANNYDQGMINAGISNNIVSATSPMSQSSMLQNSQSSPMEYNNYSISVNAKTGANPEEIANTVMSKIKTLNGRKLRGGRVNG